MSFINENYIYNMILKQLVDMCSLLMLNIDKIDVLAFNLKFYCGHGLFSLSNYIYSCLIEYLLLGERTRNINNLKLSSLESFPCLKNLEIFISNKNERLLNLNIEDTKIQINHINEIAKSSYMYCIRHNILANHLINYVLEKINLIHNKLSKFTFLMCFVKIYSDENVSNCRMKILKIIVFILAYYKHLFIELNDKNSLFIIYTISRKTISKNIEIFAYNEMCI